MQHNERSKNNDGKHNNEATEPDKHRHHPPDSGSCEHRRVKDEKVRAVYIGNRAMVYYPSLLDFLNGEGKKSE